MISNHFPFKILHEFRQSWFLSAFSTLLCPTFSLYKFCVLLFVNMLFPYTSNSDPKSFMYVILSLPNHCPVRQCFISICCPASTYCPLASVLFAGSKFSTTHIVEELRSAVTETSWNLLNFELLMGETAILWRYNFFSPFRLSNLILSPYLRVSPSTSFVGQIWKTFLREGWRFFEVVTA